jgi:CRP/FNR family cyclic AMP-dependent transcriptional regulator
MTGVNTKELQRLKSLIGFSTARLDRLAANLVVKTFNKDAIVIDQEEEAKFIYLLLSGIIKVSHVNHSERQTIVTLLRSGELFGMDSLVPRTQHAFRCEAFEACRIGLIKPQTFVEIFLGVPYQSFVGWYTAAIHPIRNAYVHCVKGIGLDLRRRLALELVNLADRFGTANPRGTLIEVSISHESLAGIVGASRQQVTEYLNDFDRDRIIFREGRRIIVNRAKLEKILASSAE